MDLNEFILTLMFLPGISRETIKAAVDDWSVERSIEGIFSFISIREPFNLFSLSMIKKVNRQAGMELEKAEKLGVGIVNFTDVMFPGNLHFSNKPPILLYYRGVIDFLNSMPGIAVVGSRHPSSLGLELAFSYAGYLATRGFCVVSGLAYGIDAAAHSGCLANGGRTVAFVPFGLGLSVYPYGNTRLAEEIVEGRGAVISEYPLDYLPEPRFFAERDRLQSGLSVGVLVVESEVFGGALYTAGDALSLGKPLAVSKHGNNIFKDSDFFSGNRELIAQGSFVIKCIDDLDVFISGLVGC